MNNEVMIDIETLSTQTNATILTIGAIRFNRKTNVGNYDDIKTSNKFYCRINKTSCEKIKMHTDPETKKWWSMQSREAQYEVFYNEENRIDIDVALKKLYEFIKGCNIFWSHSPNFDYVILENAYKMLNMEIPWKFWQLRDTRTMYDIGNVNLKTIADKNCKVTHHSLNDCYNQIIALEIALKNILK